ncbi:MAG TPA: heparinase II/III family protein, partial [Armatimonadota bacterium]|nr:heparinase II/III family protein [Armatimonadota bacterium]
MYFLSPAEIDRLKARRQQAAFAPACQAIIQQATDAIEHPLDIPREGAGWFHNYFCPDHAVALTYDVHQPTVHRCPVDGRCYEGAIYDSAWRYKTQCIIVDGLYASALAWLLTGEGHYLSHAIDVLTAYAERYAGYEPHGEYAGKGRCMGQSLDEAVWAIPLAWAYDIVQETQTAAWRASIRDRLLRPIADHLTGQAWHTIHNIECWHLAGLASLAMVLDEPDYLAPVLDQSTGLPGQCAQGIREDGWWYEGSPTYHFYTVNAILSLLLALRYRYPEYLQQPRIKAMLDAPLAAARNDLSIPAFNDGWFDVAQPGYLAGVAKFYDIAWALWEDPSYKILLNRIRATSGGPNTVEALLFGPDSLHEPEHAALGNCVQPASGYAFFRRNTDDRTQWLSYKFGPHGGGHGHMDKLSLDLHAFGERLSPDLGTPGYGIPLHHLWYRHTLSHNTVLIDQTAQPEGEGMLFHFADGTSDGFAVATEEGISACRLYAVPQGGMFGLVQGIRT